MAVQVGHGQMDGRLGMDVFGRTAGRTDSDWDICTDGVHLRCVCAEEGKLRGQRPPLLWKT
jgi:hypothetical protein